MTHASRPPECPLCALADTPSPARYVLTKEEHTYRRCPRCALVFTHPHPSAAAQHDALDEWAAAHHLAPERLEWEFSEAMGELLYAPRLAPLERYRGAAAALLDIGCAAGGFLAFARDRGWAVRGVELAADSARVAREEHGLDVFTGSLEQAPYDAHSFDAITFWDVLEHHPAPWAFLEGVRTKLRPGGAIGLATPNYDSLTRYLLGARWDALIPPRHLYVFSARSMRILLAAAGFRPVRMTTADMNPVEIVARWRTPVPDKQLRDAPQARLAAMKNALATKGWVRAGRTAVNSVLNATGAGDVLTVYAEVV